MIINVILHLDRRNQLQQPARSRADRHSVASCYNINQNAISYQQPILYQQPMHYRQSIQYQTTAHCQSSRKIQIDDDDERYGLSSRPISSINNTPTDLSSTEEFFVKVNIFKYNCRMYTRRLIYFCRLKRSNRL